MSVRKHGKAVISLLLWYLPVITVQLVAGRVTIGSIDPWYNNLNKAQWTPPSWVFSPAWTLLYIMMALAIWLVYQTKTSPQKHKLAYALFFTQLFINGLWSFLFFKFHYIGWALIDLGLLTLLVAITTFHFFRIRSAAGFLFLPYLGWIIYAFTLNAAIWWLN